MVSQIEAEELAKKHLLEYLEACGPEGATDAGNALMKMCSVVGVTLVATVGYDDAVIRLRGTAAFIEKKMAGAQGRKH